MTRIELSDKGEQLVGGGVQPGREYGDGIAELLDGTIALFGSDGLTTIEVRRDE